MDAHAPFVTPWMIRAVQVNLAEGTYARPHLYFLTTDGGAHPDMQYVVRKTLGNPRVLIRQSQLIPFGWLVPARGNKNLADRLRKGLVGKRLNTYADLAQSSAYDQWHPFGTLSWNGDALEAVLTGRPRRPDPTLVQHCRVSFTHFARSRTTVTIQGEPFTSPFELIARARVAANVLGWRWASKDPTTRDLLDGIFLHQQ